MNHESREAIEWEVREKAPRNIWESYGKVNVEFRSGTTNPVLQ